MAMFDFPAGALRNMMNDRVTFFTSDGSASVRAAVLPYAPREEMPGSIVGSAFSIRFSVDDWTGRVLPAAGSIVTVASDLSKKRLTVVQAFRVENLMHIVAAENAGAYH